MRITGKALDGANWMPSRDWLPLVSRDSLRGDFIAGLTNATLVLPQAIAFAAIAGLPPQYGFYTAMVVPIIAAIFGSSWHMVSGPTTAISALVFLTLSELFAEGSPQYIEAAITLALLVGLIQICFRVFKLGQFVTFVSHSVVVAFTAGASILIGLSQIKYALNLDLPHASEFGNFFPALFNQLPGASFGAILICFTTLAVAVTIRKYYPKAPNYIIALLVGGCIATLLPANLGIQFVAPVPAVVPQPTLPIGSLSEMSLLIPGAFAIALVGILEAVSVARSLALKSGQHLDSNREIYGQGMSNVVGSFFSAYPGSGSFTRSALNLEAGAVTPLSAVFAAISLLVIMLIFAPLVVFIPIPAMAGLIILVAWRLIDFPHIREILTTSQSETIVLLATLGGSLLVDLEFAIYSGVIVSLLLYLSRSSHSTLVRMAPDLSSRFRTFSPIEKDGIIECPQMIMSRLQGPLYFGSAENLRNVFHQLEEDQPEQKNLFIRIEASSGIDLAGAHVLTEENDRRKARNGGLFVSCGYKPIRDDMRRLHLPQLLGSGHIFRRKQQFIERMVPRLDQNICATCKARVFFECPPASNSDPVNKI
jgi:SulP family sulfate permease